MRKILFSGLAFVAFATAGFANSTELKMEKELKTMELINPCSALIAVYDSYGNLVDFIIYLGNENPRDCVDSVGEIVKDFREQYPDLRIEVTYN